MLLVEFKYGVDNGYETLTNKNDAREIAYAPCQCCPSSRKMSKNGSNIGIYSTKNTIGDANVKL